LVLGSQFSPACRQAGFSVLGSKSSFKDKFFYGMERNVSRLLVGRQVSRLADRQVSREGGGCGIHKRNILLHLDLLTHKA
jgi:hypothetical protein